MTEPVDNPFAGEMNNIATLVFGLAERTDHIDHPRVGPDVPIIEMRFRIEDDSYGGDSICFQQTLVDVRYLLLLQPILERLDLGWQSYGNWSATKGSDAVEEKFFAKRAQDLAEHLLRTVCNSFAHDVVALVQQPMAITLSMQGHYPQTMTRKFAWETRVAEVTA